MLEHGRDTSKRQLYVTIHVCISVKYGRKSVHMGVCNDVVLYSATIIIQIMTFTFELVKNNRGELKNMEVILFSTFPKSYRVHVMI